MTRLDEGNIVTVEGKTAVINKIRKIAEKENRIDSLHIDTVLGWGGAGASMSMEIYKKDAAADVYI